jgi:hypothetical protein
MSEWKISPTDGVANRGNGRFTFIPNAPYKTYTVTYTDNAGCQATYVYRLNTDCGDDPDPKPESCVTPLDNVGQECSTAKTATQEFIDAGFACEGTHWWSGPLDGEGDRGLSADGDYTEDSIRCNPNNLEFEIVDNWISYTIVTSRPGDFGHGVMHYDIAENPTPNPRHGTLKVRTRTNEHPDREYDGHPTSEYFCRDWCTIHFYQQGGDGPVTCECTTFSARTNSVDVPSSITSSEYAVARYTAATNCSETIRVSGLKSGTDFLGSFRFGSDGKIYAKVKANNPTDQERSAQYYVEQATCRDYFTVTQKKGSGETPVVVCSCDAHAIYTNNNHFSKDGSSVAVAVATVDIPEGCDCSFIDRTRIVPDTATCSANECSTFNILYDFSIQSGSGNQCIIKAKVRSNSGGTGHNVQSGNYEKWHYKINSCSNGDYFNFYQNVGSITPSTCEVTADSTLNGYVSQFNSTLGTSISVSNTPCTYKYLKAAYNTVSNRSSRTIMWTLANVMSELTPRNKMCEGYFAAASTSTYGGVPLVSDSTVGIYEDRINGGVAYALFKHNNYEASKTMVYDSRAELQSKGITWAKWGSDNDCGDLCFGRTGTTTSAPNPLSLIPSMWGNKSTTSYDYTKMAELVASYPTVESIKYVDGDRYVPLLDKQNCNHYLATIMGLGDSDDWANFIYDATDVSIASGNVAKVKEETKRPANDMYPTFNYLCDDVVEDPMRDFCDDECDGKEAYDPDFCECETNSFRTSVSSFPSGHSYKAFMALLSVVVATGNANNKVDRMEKYCSHRNYVRAHWHSDVLIGKLIASMDIGYINGYKAFQDRVDALFQ